ncbi:GRAS family protein [Selaginella moellendorffii]|uniref:GRAS family protein n=2 Tax=Selaginella moellendorffii TaxID=88036 RepID=D8QY00_SELML|nr:scarecrow-like protein 31 [Selaginella moellendorffii]EFJ35521.1 GRAS family protein [Selaginella moellendorffii]|eukprot:XP_002963650.1 scarecrow-like protein 31 [Selaginella moellendorffii]
MEGDGLQSNWSESQPVADNSNNQDHGYAQSLFDSFIELDDAGDHQIDQQTDNLVLDQQTDDLVAAEEAKLMRYLKASIVKCCEAIAANATTQAYELVSELRDKSSPTGTTVERLAFYFSEALVARSTGTGSLLYNGLIKSKRPIDEILQLFATVAETSPGFGLPIFFTNQTILDETSSAARVHVVDFGIGPGYRWLCLIKDFSERSGGPPHFRVTAVDRPSNSLLYPREDVGAKLGRYASSLGVPFEFHSVVTADWDSIGPSQLMIQPDDVLIVTSFHKLRELSDDPKRRFLRNIHAMEPKLFLNAAFPPVGFNSPSLVARAREAFEFYAGMFEAIAASLAESRFAGERRFLEQLRGLELLNTLACEGEERVERPEGYKQWQELMRGAGFEGYEIKRHVYAGAKKMLATYSNAREYSVGRSGNWILLRRNRQVLIAISNWTC